jgi:hypothetical protein
MAALVIGGHIAMWNSDRMDREQKLRLTLINATGWGIVILPAFGVAMWARAHRGRRDDRRS